MTSDHGNQNCKSLTFFVADSREVGTTFTACGCRVGGWYSATKVVKLFQFSYVVAACLVSNPQISDCGIKLAVFANHNEVIGIRHVVENNNLLRRIALKDLRHESLANLLHCSRIVITIQYILFHQVALARRQRRYFCCLRIKLWRLHSTF